MALFESSVKSRPVWCPTIESSVTLPVTRMSPHAEVRLLSITSLQERLHVTAVVGANIIVPCGLRNPRQPHLMVMSVTVMVCRRLQY